jgi:ceramide glucosyltransferase
MHPAVQHIFGVSYSNAGILLFGPRGTGLRERPFCNVTFALAAFVLISTFFLLLSITAAHRYLAVRPAVLRAPVPISILKPLAGLDRNLETNLRTFFEQDYRDFEILFALRSADDPAFAVVEKLRGEYPGVPSRVLITGEPPYANAKVYSLDRMLAAAGHDLLVMSDSDIRVTPTMLQTIAAEFQNPGVGVATCPYRAIPAADLWSKLEATGLNTDFMAGILAARMLEGMRFAVGPTIAARRQVLAAIGGFARLKDYLAEDFVMGRLAADGGHGVILSSYVIEHHIGSAGCVQNFAHRLRWLRSTRRSRPSGYVGQFFTMTTPLAGLLLLADPRWWLLALSAIALRILAAYVVSWRVLRCKLFWPLLLVEDVTGFLFWIAGFFGRTILWRGERYLLNADGRFVPLK